jgi:hypothetical protein
MDQTGSGSCSMVGFETFDSTTSVTHEIKVRKINLQGAK